MVLEPMSDAAHSYWVSAPGAGFVGEAAQAQSDQNGRFIIGSVRSGRYELDAHRPGQASARSLVIVDHADVGDVSVAVTRP
jgi:hypothetical protein